jgi:hypothetical protein
MSDIREMTDVRELDPIELAEVMGGFGDGYCGTVPLHFPIFIPGPPPPPVGPPWWW